ncbi:gpi-anchored wall transfer protein [Plasmopara halstedii]|uniref:Gpi-anchored wall transfer protein n=1 Tax=Plasmopara halstedii TaxID=4781 RepID=A0A0N7L4V0_PLAHL|nr:gpi-anchored wall transfer protein [Plasmopara halstedii]CEG39691.1 gpi-anchored wall transfer protein [Plasmopara halstedii]|eukprot:XP_024576060.1 gpi-anchored wall transfer protein [Plasmopara halstedii]
MDKDYKLAKEAFVTGLHGTSASEVFIVFALAPGSLWLYNELMLVLEIFGIQNLGATYLNLFTTILVEFVVTVVPTMIGLSFTQYAIPLLATLYSLAATFCALSRLHSKDYVRKYCRKEKMNGLVEKELPFLTNFRAQIMMSTCFAILAVDFTVFPRRFAKTENYGFSVMDIGVGAFIVSSAIVSAPARQARPRITTDRHRIEHPQSILERLYLFFRPIALVLLFGVARFLAVRGVNYQEHVSEYGVHWNFYFTLAGVYFVYSILRIFGKWATNPIVALLIAFIYQIYLSLYDGEKYMLDGLRDNLLNQNREGVFSLAGYTSLYLLSTYAGQCIFSSITFNHVKAQRSMRWLVISLIFISGLLWTSTLLAVRLIASPSRRMLNITYMLWVMAQSLTLVALYGGIQLVCMLPRVPLLNRGINQNQLFVFIVANLMTGAINLTVDTISANTFVSSGILIVYMLAVCVLASALQHANIRIKL